MPIRPSRMILAHVLVPVLALCAGGAAWADETPQVADAMAGQALYLRHCVTCHGVEGKGDGPMSPVLLVQPKDLTRLSVENDGVFPFERVAKRIDGREPLVSHGSDMPVYGDLFRSVEKVPLKTESGQPVLMAPAVADLVVYLQALQETQ